MIKVLVVSDNSVLIDHVKFLSIRSDIASLANFEFSYSAINKSPEELVKRGMKKVDVRAEADLLIRQYDLIISAHCKQIFPANLVNNISCINIHPGFNPYNRGWYPQVFSIINRKPIGATIHLMDEEIDNGAILYQKQVKADSWDTSLSLYNKVIEVEKKLLDRHLVDILRSQYFPQDLDCYGNYNSPDDFNDLCSLNLDHVGSMREHIDLLRALSHGDFKNAYFYDEENKKVYVKVDLEAVDETA
ncbi:dTDP-4-amino-4,6-dideoxyglucose formyltransferase [Porticoccus sp. GXU_MW_L64]